MKKSELFFIIILFISNQEIFAQGINIPKGTWGIGIGNSANEIKGVQLGLLNYVHSNPKGLRLLPLINARF